MRVYQRQETGVELRTADVPFYPFFFLTDIRLLHGFTRPVSLQNATGEQCIPLSRRVHYLADALGCCQPYCEGDRDAG